MAVPGLGFVTATENVPAELSLPVAMICVEDTNVVASGAPARSTCAPLTNPPPFRVIAKTPAGTDVGAMVVSTGTGFCKVTALLSVAEASAKLTARTVTVLKVGNVLGAANMPDELIVPVAALPPVTPFTCQVTEVFDDPATVAVKCCVAPARTFALAGEMETVTLDPEGGVFEPGADVLFVVPVQPASNAAARRSTKSAACRDPYFLSFFIRKHTESASVFRRFACAELCLGGRQRTTVRKYKMRVGACVQG